MYVTSWTKPKMKMIVGCWQILVFFVEFSEAGKQNKRHIEESNNKPRTQLSGKEACVLLTADERTTGTRCCNDVSDSCV